VTIRELCRASRTSGWRSPDLTATSRWLTIDDTGRFYGTQTVNYDRGITNRSDKCPTRLPRSRGPFLRDSSSATMEIRPYSFDSQAQDHDEAASPSVITLTATLSPSRRPFHDPTMCACFACTFISTRHRSERPTPKCAVAQIPDRTGVYEPGRTCWLLVCCFHYRGAASQPSFIAIHDWAAARVHRSHCARCRARAALRHSA